MIQKTSPTLVSTCKIPFTTLVRALGSGDDEIVDIFGDKAELPVTPLKKLSTKPSRFRYR